ncbi:glycosyltransferase family 2 protein [Coraliomargarita sp. SDUM461004]|uniref:Glycosyltransferase family 2 protein n=1 Tax=Thalassobacterium sedimentorum TaxID=3041258 RepID=A0ABU1AMF9_9BACT|nr:glycosyltransferase family 2 protein [Coraliomargarita sp. SDUM461004]MDQ8195929.1 glycosyltransferase family 2 protein [Coraliomargarita sp. SDUM461004]
MIAVLITVFNRKEETLRCLGALELATVKIEEPLHVFLVDDASSDGTTAAVKDAFPNVTLIPGDGKCYWNGGMRLAWETAKNTGDYDYYLWLNNDSYLFEESLSTLLQYAKSTQDEAILCAQTISEKTGKRSYGGWRRGNLPLLFEDGVAPCDIINGNCVLVPRQVFEQVGLLDPNYKHALGDHDYGLRASEKGICSLVIEQPLAYCEANPRPPLWCQQEQPLGKRIKNLYSPLANSHPKYYFIYERRHYGMKIACFHFLTIHLRVLLPQLWKNQ